MVNPIKSLYYQYFWWQRKQPLDYKRNTFTKVLPEVEKPLYVLED